MLELEPTDEELKEIEEQERKEELAELWIEQAETETNNKFNRNKLPSGVQLFLKEKFKRSTQDANIHKKQLSDMSITYFSNQDMSEQESDLLRPYYKMKVI